LLEYVQVGDGGCREKSKGAWKKKQRKDMMKTVGASNVQPGVQGDTSIRRRSLVLPGRLDVVGSHGLKYWVSAV